MEILGVGDFAELFARWVENMNGFWVTLNSPVSKFVTETLVGLAPENSLLYKTVLGFFNYIFGDLDITLLALIIGSGLGFYVTWQFISWIIDLLP